MLEGILMYWPALVYAFVALAVGLVPFVFSFFLHFYQKKYLARSLTPYECGFDPIDTGAFKFHISFYAVALSFIVFDLEMLFLVPWACSLQIEKSYDLLLGGIFFICFLLVGLYYEYDQGVLDHASTY